MPLEQHKEKSTVSKPEWGQKRSCSGCGCRFYDLTRMPIVCPKCAVVLDAETPFKTRRSSVIAEAKAARATAAKRNVVEREVEEPEEPAEENEEDESGLIEDASDLGGDDDDMAEVMEHIDEELSDEV